ncbi:Uma2 family endonuclease [Geminocystis herdmanii]|uniref:Uma2 family endonuclease n=1 Tax=Geminocystis herdmanii TaxID=669359 RepID=UPI0003483338|nr:Uma2 family endonuclease [Geminocystis herdmanii]
MTITPIKKTTLTLEEFLQQDYIEESPAYEYIDNAIVRKSMPQGKHSQIQYKICEVINQFSQTDKVAYGLPELRCNFGNRSIVPDIAVFFWERIPLDEEGEIANQFNSYPDWCIEILSPNQKPTKVIDNILFCLEYGTQLGWLIDSDEKIILVFEQQKPLKIYRHEEILPVINNLNLELTVNQIFSWLKIK